MPQSYGRPLPRFFVTLWLVLALATGSALAVNTQGAGVQGPSASDQQENPLKSLSLEQLGKVEVTTVSKEPEQVWKTPAAIYVITQDDIRRSGATNIPEALRLAPGVEVARIDGNKWSIGIRGFGSRLARSVLVLIDGRTVYTTLFAGTYWEVQDTMMEDIDRIEVIRGPGGTIWGPNAVNGVINIITKNSKDTHGALASAGGGNVEQGFYNLRSGSGNEEGLNYRVYTKGFTRGPEFHADERNFDDWRGAQAGFRIDWENQAETSFRLEGDLYDERAGESVVATNYTAPFSQTIDANARLSGGNVTGHWHKQLSERGDIQVQAYYDRTNRREPNFGDIRNTFDADFLQRQLLPARQRLSWGGGLRFSHGEELEVVTGLTFDPPQLTDRLITGFVQDEISLVPDRLSLIGGSKFLNTNFTGFEAEPSVRLLFTPSKTETAWAAFTRAVRTPADVERNFFLSGFIGTGPGGLPFFARFNANRNFQPEKLKGYEAGYRRLLGRDLYVDVAGYFNQYNNLFSQEITGPPFLENTPPPLEDNIVAPTHLLLPAQFGNGLQGTTAGVEVAPEWKPVPYWRLRGSYSFLAMHIKPNPGSLDIGTAHPTETSSPEHQVYAQSSFDLSKAISLDLIYRYVSALPAQGVKPYSTADATWSWALSDHYRLTVVGQNLLRPHHAEAGGDPNGIVEIRRGVYGKLTWSR